MNPGDLLPVDRFLQTLEIVCREGKHLAYSHQRLYSGGSIDAAWVSSLEQRPELAERLEAFVSRFGRMQDTIADKLLPRWLAAMAESPGSQIEVLNRAERLGVIQDVEQWLQARTLRNRLIHEYMNDAEAFARDLESAGDSSKLLIDTYNRLRDFAQSRMAIEESRLPVTVEIVA